MCVSNASALRRQLSGDFRNDMLPSRRFFRADDAPGTDDGGRTTVVSSAVVSTASARRLPEEDILGRSARDSCAVSDARAASESVGSRPSRVFI